MMNVDIVISLAIGKTVALNIGKDQEEMVTIEGIDLLLVLLRVLNLIGASIFYNIEKKKKAFQKILFF